MANVKAPGSHDLKTLETVIQQQEGIFGPLTEIKGIGNENLMTFQVAASPDQDHRAVLGTFAGVPPPKPGFAVVCTGNCMVSNAPQNVVVYRKTP